MMRTTTQRLLLASALLAVFALTVAANDPFPISHDSKGDDRYPSVAVNTRGDMYIVWSREFTGRAVLYGSFCKLKSNGSYRVGKARELSPANGFILEPQVAYSKKSDSFLVLWMDRNPDEIPNGRDILTRRISSKGKTLGPAKILKGGPARDRHAVLAPMQDGRFIIAWERLLFGEHARMYPQGIFTMILSADGKVDEEERNVLLPDLDSRDVFDAAWPEDVAISEDGNVLIAGTRYIFEQAKPNDVPFGYTHAFLLTLNKERRTSSVFTRDERYSCDARVSPVSDKTAMLAFNVQNQFKQDGFAQAYRIDGKLKRQGSVADYDSEKIYITPDLLQMADGGARLLYVRNREELLAKSIDKGGNIDSVPTDLTIQSGLDLRDVRSIVLPGQNKAVVVYADISDFDGKLWGMVVDLEN